MTRKTSFKIIIALMITGAITGVGLGIAIWWAIDTLKPHMMMDNGHERLFGATLSPIFPFMAAAWGCMLVYYCALTASPTSRKSGLYGLAEVLTLFVVTFGVWIGAYVYFGGTAYTQWLVLIAQVAYVSAALNFGLVLGLVLLIRLLVLRQAIPPRMVIQ
jgi:hypothetical protein